MTSTRSQRDQAAEIIAALNWDVPRLVHGSLPARTFVESFSPERAEPPADQPIGSSDGALLRAAHGVWLERVGRQDAAAEVFAGLASASGLEGLLGLVLLAWSGGSESDAVISDAASVAADEIGDTDQLARVLGKLATLAEDKGWQTQHRDMLSRALEMASEGSRLRAALAAEAFNHDMVGAEELFPSEEASVDSPTDDDLVSQPWIESLALAAGREASEKRLDARLSGAWSWSIQIGGVSPLDKLVAAEVQATWAGTPWVRRGIRKQVGAHILDGRAGDAAGPGNWAYGFLMWAFGGGSRLRQAFDAAEPFLDPQGIDLIVTTLGRDASSRNSRGRFLDVLQASWDVYSDSLLGWVLEQVCPEPVDHPQLADAQQVWAGVLWRSPELWEQRFLALDGGQRVGLAPFVPPEAIVLLSSSARAEVGAAALAAIEAGPVAGEAYQVALTASDRESADELRTRMPAGVAVAIADVRPELLDERNLQAAEDACAAAVSQTNADAREGKIALGMRSMTRTLARIAIARGIVDSDVADLLLETATDEALPGESRLEGRAALAELAVADLLSADARQILRAASDTPGQFPEHGNVTPQLLRAFRLLALARGLKPSERAEVTGLSRDQDPRVRSASIDAAGIALRKAPDDGLVWSLVAGLFDPDADVLRRALAAIRRVDLTLAEGAREVAYRRVPRLYRGADRRTRAEVARTCRLLTVSASGEALELDSTVEEASHDRSWRVRRAATVVDELGD